MANYKKITDVAALTETSETTNVLVEENGSLKKVPASAIGGSGNSNFLIIRYKEEAAPKSLESDPSNTYIANMTFAEFDEAVQNGELAGMRLNYLTTNSSLALFDGTCIDTRYYPDYYYLMFYNQWDGWDINLKFYSDNTIEEYIDNEPQ